MLEFFLYVLLGFISTFIPFIITFKAVAFYLNFSDKILAEKESKIAISMNDKTEIKYLLSAKYKYLSDKTIEKLIEQYNKNI